MRMTPSDIWHWASIGITLTVSGHRLQERHGVRPNPGVSDVRITVVGSLPAMRPTQRLHRAQEERAKGPTGPESDSDSAADGAGSLSTVARGSFVNLVGAAVSAAANFGLVFVVAHGLSVTSAGVFFSATSLFLVVESLGRLGADTGLVYFIARWRAQQHDRRIRAGLRYATGPVVGLCGVLAAAGVFLAPQTARLLDDSSGWTVGLLRLLAIVLPIAAAYDLALGASRGFGWMGPTVLVEKIGRSVLQLCLVAVVLACGWTSALGYAWTLPYVGGLLVVSWLLAARLRMCGARGAAEADLRPVRREFWAFTLPRAIAGVAQVVLQRLDIVLVAAMRGPRDAAIYTAATRFLVVGQFINQALTAPIQPHLSAAFAGRDDQRARELYEMSTAWLVLASWPLFGIAAALAPEYVNLFGHGYHSGALVVVILSAAMFVASGVGLVDTVIIMAGRTAWNLQTTLLALVVNVGLDLALIPHFGIVGAAFGWFGSIMAANVVPLLIAWRRLSLHPFGGTTNRALSLCGVSWIALPLGFFLLSGRSEVGAGMGLVAGAVLYAAGLWRWRSAFHLRELMRRRPAASGAT
jgi:O-antigen/teichoic acid export membrane protein